MKARAAKGSVSEGLRKISSPVFWSVPCTIFVIVLRAHYTMAVFTAVFAAWGADAIARHLAPSVDLWLGRLW